MSVAAFDHVGEWASSPDDGRYAFATIRKAMPTTTTTANTWVDLSMSTGQPKAQYYAADPLVAATLDGSKGIWHGPDQAPSRKALASLCLMTPTAALAGAFRMLDYLLFYPFVDGDDLTPQPLDNATAIPRYTDGDGVQVMAVALAPTTGGGAFTFDYTNQDGDAKTSQSNSLISTSVAIGTLVRGAGGGSSGVPFLALAAGDTGVRSIESVTFSVAAGGLIALVLVKPIRYTAIREINTPTETETFTQRTAPRIYDGAYLNLIACVSGSIASGTLAGFAETYWTED